ncbi:hypothetical protein [Pseudomonas sp. Kh13]|uniref:hypothetical protein n=1 Tax=Pseudomonas sp. Kh13 TaxID=2093744 RepID=UPI0011838BB4|nr:hypothetical protein [Pseudomonas sp. Kh13]
MADLWEPVGGVFWSAPPAVVVPDEVWPHWPATIVLLVAAIAIGVVAVRIAQKRNEPEWHLRQHMVEVGSAATLIYLAGIAALTGDRIGTLGDMPLNEVGDFLAGAFGPVAFLWLVLGFLMQSEELKNTVDQHKAMVRVTREQHDRAIKALFTFEASPLIYEPEDGSGGPRKVQSNVRITNEGNKALKVVLGSDQTAEAGEVINLGAFPEGHSEEITFSILLLENPKTGEIWIEYEDLAGDRRIDTFAYTVSDTGLNFVRGLTLATN